MREIKVELNTAHVVCRECGTRWTISFRHGNTPPNPRECKNYECEAGWLDLPMFMDEADADRFAAEREAVT